MSNNFGWGYGLFLAGMPASAESAFHNIPASSKMKLSLILLLPILSGCAIEKFNSPAAGYASIVTHHTRFFGLRASYAGYGVMLGWGSDTFSVIPVNTNKLYTATLSDTFRLGQSMNPFGTSITEDVQTGWSGTNGPPPPRYNTLFHKKPDETR